MAQHAHEIITNHPKTSPLFMYLPFQDVHEPLQVPEKYLKLYPNITNKSRKIFSGNQLFRDTALDEFCIKSSNGESFLSCFPTQT